MSYEPCPGSRPYNPANNTCSTCVIDCIGKAAHAKCSKTARKAPDCPATPRTGKSAGKEPRKRGEPNKTEAAYGCILKQEAGYEPHYEGLTFRLKNGHKYTPDWVVMLPDMRVLCVEVKARGKNGYRQPSYQRARVMFDQCRVEWPNYSWRWAERVNGEWEITDY